MTTLPLGNTTDMADIPELILSEQVDPEELTEIIAELEQYRERLVNDTLSMAQRAKVMKKQALANLEPSLAQIDATLEALRQQQATLSS
jgi:hypothetical protein